MNKVAHVYKRITIEPYVVHKSESLDRVLSLFKQINPIHRSLYVIDEYNEFLGIITLQEIFNLYTIKQGKVKVEDYTKPSILDYLLSDSTAEQIMRKISPVTIEDSLERAVEIMIKENLHELPVVNDRKNIIGDLNVHELLRDLQIKT